MRQALAIAGVLLLAITSAHGATPPKPTKSEYLVSTGAGFTMTRGEGLNYGMNYELRKQLAAPLFIVATFENPETDAPPLRAELVVDPGTKEFAVQSPLIKVITHDKTYEVLLQLYADAEHTRLLSTHKQLVLFSVPPGYEAALEEQMGIRIL